MAKGSDNPILKGLNEPQTEAVCHGNSPLLVVAGAGTGKTRTLVHRVARLIENGADPSRILLLTFTRRAAAEMLRRVRTLLAELGDGSGPNVHSAQYGRVWGGTFHATASRLLRIHGRLIGLDPDFTIHDRGDSEDLLDVLRTELGFAKTDKRFPKKRTCLAIYSHCLNARKPLDAILDEHYQWCAESIDQLKALFVAYTDRKETAAVLDYDDLLLFWESLLAHAEAGPKIRDRFDSVLVDEFQDTNHLQAEILMQLCPEGCGLTVVGDDAQSIYSFRAATVRNILDFPKHYPGTTIVKLEQNYRSTQPILRVTNALISQSKEWHAKELWSTRGEGELPLLVACEDEHGQAEFVAERVLDHREAGIDLGKQAVLFRASHNSIALEAELARRKIPFVKYGGLRFVEAAHVKDVLAYLRLAENPRDVMAGTRVLKLLPGIGSKTADRLMKVLQTAKGDLASWEKSKVPATARSQWSDFVKLLRRLNSGRAKLRSQVRWIYKFYTPLLLSVYDSPEPRKRDLEQLELLMDRYTDRRTLLAEIALDPPATTDVRTPGEQEDNDFLVLSTVHSAKGLEWDVVFTITALDGTIPFVRAVGSKQQIEEERRLLYVALTRARDWLYVCYPLRVDAPQRGMFGPSYGICKKSRFITKSVQKQLRQVTAFAASEIDAVDDGTGQANQVRDRVRTMFG